MRKKPMTAELKLVSTRLEPGLWKKVRILAFQKDMTVQQLISYYIRQGLSNEKEGGE